MKSLVDDYSKYLQSFEMLLENSAEHQCMIDFIHGTLADILGSIGPGEPTLNVMGVGSGSGEIDLEILKVLHVKHPDAKVENEVVEPSDAMLNKYKALLSKTPGLEFTTFRWNSMTAAEFRSNWKNRNSEKKMHFVHMIQMLYYVEDPEAMVSFFRSLLHKDGKLLVILETDKSAWDRLFEVYQDQLCKDGLNLNLTARKIKSFLDSSNVSYKNYKFHSMLDITDCFTPGHNRGERLLDLLTEVTEFSKNAPPELKQGVLEFLKHPDNSQEVNGRILFDCSTEALLIDA